MLLLCLIVLESPSILSGCTGELALWRRKKWVGLKRFKLSKNEWMEVFNLLSDVKIRFATLTARAIKFLILSSSLCSSELVFAQMEPCRAAVLLGSENFHSLMRNVPLHHIYRLFSACKFLTFINQIIAVPLPTPLQPCGEGVPECPGLNWVLCSQHLHPWERVRKVRVFLPPSFSLKISNVILLYLYS